MKRYRCTWDKMMNLIRRCWKVTTPSTDRMTALEEQEVHLFRPKAVNKWQGIKIQLTKKNRKSSMWQKAHRWCFQCRPILHSTSALFSADNVFHKFHNVCVAKSVTLNRKTPFASTYGNDSWVPEAEPQRLLKQKLVTTNLRFKQTSGSQVQRNELY